MSWGFRGGFYSGVIVPVLINFTDLFSNTVAPKITWVNTLPMPACVRAWTFYTLQKYLKTKTINILENPK